MSVALFMNVSPVMVILSAEACDALLDGLFLARQCRTVATRCIRLDATGSKGKRFRVDTVPPEL